MDREDERSIDRQTVAARRLFQLLGDALDLDCSVRLWDAGRVALGKNVQSPYEIVVASPRILSSMVRRPTGDNWLLHYARGDLKVEGGDPLGFVSALKAGRGFKKLRQVPKAATLKALLSVGVPKPDHAAAAEALRGAGESEDHIRFHYDLGNDFYALFLDAEMQYSCGYFEDSSQDLDRAQQAKLEAICGRLELQRGDRFLDVGCGWGGLLCHAALRYGVRAHGVTLSQEQFDYTREKIQTLGLAGRVSVELGGYEALEGKYDKIASIEMFEHVGLEQIPGYLRKLRSLLGGGGLLLNQGTTRRAKRTAFASRRLRVGSRMMERYIFPGFEIDNVGHTVAQMEAARFEIQRVEGWRAHYARTTELWCRRLWANREQAESLIGPEKTRLWLAYLAGVSSAFEGGTLRVYQIVASRPKSDRPIGGTSITE